MFLSAAFVVEHYLRVSAERGYTSLLRDLNADKIVRQQLFHRSSLWYGTVVSVSSGNHVVVDFADRFLTEEKTIRMQVAVLPDTRVARQTLVARDGVYVGYTTQGNISLSDIRGGERVAVVMRTTESGEAIAEVLIVGGII